MEGMGDPVASLVTIPSDNDDLRYALDLLNHGYFWESHVYFEALWNAHKRVGPEADFFKAMIKLGAAAIKLEMGENQRAQEHFERALELFKVVMNETGESFLGFHLPTIMSDVSKMISSQTYSIIILPDWA